jgi:hypothetical protein
MILNSVALYIEFCTLTFDFFMLIFDYNLLLILCLLCVFRKNNPISSSCNLKIFKQLIINHQIDQILFYAKRDQENQIASIFYFFLLVAANVPLATCKSSTCMTTVYNTNLGGQFKRVQLTLIAFCSCFRRKW